MTLWAQEKASITAQEANFLKEEAEAKREMRMLKLDREREFSELLKREVTDRIKFQIEKHAAEMEIIALQKAKLIL